MLLLGAVVHRFVVPYFGRVVRYTQATPDNIAARKNVRERGLKLLAELHQGEYERIIIVGHSLGSIVAYDLISYFWATRTASHSVNEGTAEFRALCDLVRATESLVKSPTGARREEVIEAYLKAQTLPNASEEEKARYGRSRYALVNYRFYHARLPAHYLPARVIRGR